MFYPIRGMSKIFIRKQKRSALQQTLHITNIPIEQRLLSGLEDGRLNGFNLPSTSHQSQAALSGTTL